MNEFLNKYRVTETLKGIGFLLAFALCIWAVEQWPFLLLGVSILFIFGVFKNMGKEGHRHSPNTYFLLGGVTGICGTLAVVRHFKDPVAWICVAIFIGLTLKVHRELDD